MKKHLNTDTVANELRNASAFFRPRSATPLPTVESIPEPAGTGEAHQDAQQAPRTMQPVRRRMKRHPFEIYEDQYDSLVRFAAEERMSGGVGSMSRMVRSALDRLIAERRREGE